MTLLRWILAAPLTVVAWYAVLLSGVLALGTIDVFCSEDQRVSGGCEAWWYDALFYMTIAVFAALSAVAVVLVFAFVVPLAKRECALFAFILGAGVAGFFFAVDPPGFMLPFVSALAGGWLGIKIAWRIWPSDDVVEAPQAVP